MAAEQCEAVTSDNNKTTSSIPLKEDMVVEMEMVTPLPSPPRHSSKRRRSTLSTSYPPSLSPRLLSHPSSPILTRPQLYRRGTSSSSSGGTSRIRPKSTLSSPWNRSNVLYAKDYMRWMLGGFTRAMSGASLTLGVVDSSSSSSRGSKWKRGRLGVGTRRMGANGKTWNRPVVVTA